METCQEIEVWYIIPSIRRELAIAMKKQGIKQKIIAALLGITPSAVSQYLKKKRAKEIKFNDKIKKEIINASKRIKEDKLLLPTEVQGLLRLIKGQGVTCQCHKVKNRSLEKCNIIN